MVKPIRQPLVLAAAAFALAFLIAFLRRGGNLLSPQLWTEDGIYMVPHFLTHGWWPLKGEEGYLTVVPHLISNLALTFAPQSFVEVSTWLAWIFMAGAAAIIAGAPTLLKGRLWLALACFLVPTDPEIFGIPLYSFWWVGLLLLLLPFWQPEPKQGVARATLLILAGLSSPIAIVTAPAMAARALILRHRTDIALAVIALLCAAAQIYFVAKDPDIDIAKDISWATPRLVVEKFFGWFAWEAVRPNIRDDLLLAGFAVIAVAGAVAWKSPNRAVALGLLYLLGGTVATSVSRIDLALLNPLDGGPRYFFYPFVLLAWILIQGLFLRPFAVGRILCAGILAGALYNAVATGWSRGQEDLSLDRHLASCLHFEVYALPLQWVGYASHVMRHDYAGEQCARLGGDPAFDPAALYPFAVRPREEAIARKEPVEIVGPPPLDVAGAESPLGFRMIGFEGDATGEVSMTLSRGARLLFANAADSALQSYAIEANGVSFRGELPLCPAQCSLDFSLDLLPARFTVTLADRGAAPGDWFSVGLPRTD